MPPLKARWLTALVAVALVLAVAGAGAGAGADDARPTVQLRAEATVQAPEVLLGQVSEIVAAGELREKLAGVSLGSGPVAGTQRVIDAGYIRLRLRRFGIDPAGVDLQGQQVTVSASAVAHGPLAPQVAPAGQGGAPDVAAPLVKRGQSVEVRVQCGGVIIFTTGRALMDAAAQELVKITLQDSNRTLTARVTGPAEAEYVIAGSGT